MPDVAVEKAVVVGEPLDPGAFSDGQPSVEVLVSGRKVHLILTHLDHFGCRRVERDMAIRGQDGERLLVPRPHPIPGHENGAIPRIVQFVIAHGGEGSSRDVFQIPDDFAQILFSPARRRKNKLLAEIVAIADNKNSLAILRHTIIAGFEKLP